VAGPLAQAQSSRRADKDNAASNVPDSFGRLKACVISVR